MISVRGRSAAPIRGRSARPSLAAATLAALALVSGCGYVEGSPPPSGPVQSQAEPPLPPGATVHPGPQTPSPERSCANLTASLPPLTDPPQVPTPTVGEIRARGRLIVGLDTGSNLMSFRDPASGTVQGFDADIAREVARDLFGDPERVEFRLLTSADRLRALEAGDVDIVVKTMSITCERREHVSFSTEYFEANQRIAVIEGSTVAGPADLAGRRVCVVDGTTSLTRIGAIAPTATIVSVPMWSDCLVLLQQQQVDAVSTDDTILGGMITQDPYLKMVGPSLGAEPYGVGIPPGDDDMVRFVNATLERIRADGTWMSMYNRWLWILGPAFGPPTPVYGDVP
ncbi:glutamate ABC transporter substrate-binding protein [Rhodococcus rhodnii]|uniref:Amino acid ABC transporter ATP-binding protein n=1 Tax=Rhodococcus rhodnii LMG 5362 TaxID=1273125 RepID=R7WRN1_9NOCA|nr:glutamate ABC transporter substrate-binding protein [Rhodococcus rhodnii]EOM77987.1 amino acid ABC transporter ATP-binding protein [Rhodococcus rhodnii LMG 5362]